VSELTDLTLAAATEAIRAKRVSPLELVEAYLARIERLNPHLCAYVTVTAERARADARRATEEIAWGALHGPLHGVPIGLKDLVDTAGIRTTYGSKVHAANVPTRATVSKLAARRRPPPGDEHAEYASASRPTTASRNDAEPVGPVAHPERRLGRSRRLVSRAPRSAPAPAGHPHSRPLCGVVGLKPTFGREQGGRLPMAYLFDHVGPIARTVEDAAIVLAAIAGYDPVDATGVATPVDYRARLRDGIQGLRVGVARTSFRRSTPTCSRRWRPRSRRSSASARPCAT
jgi:aspartyl-tRNA(Asn)/glutamyl-tRNA(Gln) amidotransferase subunit A